MLLLAFDSQPWNTPDFSQIRANWISLKWPHYICTKSRDSLCTLFLSFCSAISSSHCSLSTFITFYWLSSRSSAMYTNLHSFLLQLLSAVVFLNVDVSILLLLLHFYYFKTGNSPVLPFTVKHGWYPRCYSSHPGFHCLLLHDLLQYFLMICFLNPHSSL